ncbi:unnamed protein product [Mytilus coruscus]|uniref:C-type lectin domain-containing protein n=1 Tax=Mytilus coruscus TaxID=42192 RepID=A0A6J8AEQ2_MYTCO|nr:unnamed protein product [Mytilus coruscus]
MIGSYTANDVIYRRTVRSKIECTVTCSYDSSCQSCLYEKTEQHCTLLFVGTQSGQLVLSNDSFHFNKCSSLGCPDGYDLLTLSRVCVKLLPTYMKWTESKSACQLDGTDLAVLNTDVLFMDFLYYMDNVTKLTLRVSVAGTIIGNDPKWSNGEVVNPNKFCPGRPTTLNKAGICLYMKPAQEYETCHPVNRIIDDRCSQGSVPGICMKVL